MNVPTRAAVTALLCSAVLVTAVQAWGADDGKNAVETKTVTLDISGMT